MKKTHFSFGIVSNSCLPFTAVPITPTVVPLNVMILIKKYNKYLFLWISIGIELSGRREGLCPNDFGINNS